MASGLLDNSKKSVTQNRAVTGLLLAPNGYREFQTGCVLACKK